MLLQGITRAHKFIVTGPPLISLISLITRPGLAITFSALGQSSTLRPLPADVRKKIRKMDAF